MLELDALELLPEQALALGAQHGQVVEPLIGRDNRDRVGLDVGVDGGNQPVELGNLEKGVLEPDLDVIEVEGVVAELDGPAAQVISDAVAVAFEVKGGGFCHLALVAMGEGVAQLGRIDRAGGRGFILPVALKRRLARFSVDLGVVDDLEPSHERLVEQRQRVDRRGGELGEEVGLDELEETLDFAPAFRVVGRAEDALDAEGGTDGVELIGDVDLGPVDVDGQGAAIAEHGPFEAIFQSRELFVPVKLGVRHQTCVVVEESKEKDLALLAGMGGIGQHGSMHRVSLPQVAEVGALEAAVRLGPLLGEELGRRRVAERQLAAQGTWRDGFFRDWLRGIHAQGVDDGSRRPVRLLAFERLGAVEGLGRDGPRPAAVIARFRLETIKAMLLVLALPTSQRWHADGTAGGVGDLVVTSSDLLAQAALVARLELVTQQGQDERVPEQRNGGATLFGIDTFGCPLGHTSTSWIGVGASIPAGQGLEKMQNSVGGLPDRCGGSQRASGRIARLGDRSMEIGLEGPRWCSGQDRRPEQTGWKRLALQPMD